MKFLFIFQTVYSASGSFKIAAHTNILPPLFPVSYIPQALAHLPHHGEKKVLQYGKTNNITYRSSRCYYSMQFCSTTLPGPSGVTIQSASPYAKYTSTSEGPPLFNSSVKLNVWEVSESEVINQSPCLYFIVHRGIKMERHRGVNLRYFVGGDPLCTLLCAEGLYS